MAVLCDTQIRELVGIEPFEDSDKPEGRVSCGLSSSGDEGIAQIVFIKADRVCATSCAEKGGEYQDQARPTLPRVG